MSEVDAVRRAYEGSLSWRLTRPVRAAGRRARALRGARDAGVGAAVAPPRWDGWLESVAGERLAAIDDECADLAAAGRAAEAMPLFRGIDLDAWALLLTGEHEAWPGVRAALPAMPEPVLQEWWNGASGLRLAAQSARFAERVVTAVERHGRRPLAESRGLDHGCGWGRLLRLMARELPPGELHGVDPNASIIGHCRRDGVPAELHVIEADATALPVRDVDVAWSFSVFTHLSPAATDRALTALHGTLREGGLLVATVRPPDWLADCPEMAPALRALGPDWREAMRGARHEFVAHAAHAEHPQYDGGEMDYGDAVVTVARVREAWAPRFELLEVAPLLGDLHQLVLTLRRGPDGP